jgi:TolB-like protein
VTAAAERLAILPFAPEHEDTALARIGEELAVTVALTLGAVPNVSVVDPPSVLGRAGGRLTAAQAREVARALGARYFVFGELEREHGALRFEGGLSPADSGYQSRVFASGPEADLVAATDSIAAAVLFKIWASHHMPAVSLTAATTGSSEALAAFLAGERDLGAGRTSDAAGDYARAVGADSIFRLAWERLSRVASQRRDTAMVNRARRALASLATP